MDTPQRQSRVAREFAAAEARKQQKVKDEFHKRRRAEIEEGKRTNGATANRRKRRHGRSR